MTDPVIVRHAPAVVALPDAAALAAYLSITAAQQTPAVVDGLTEACRDATDYELSRLSYALMTADGAAPPDTVPSPVARAVLMHAARLYRRRNSVNGFEGLDDLGTVPVRAQDPDIERMVDQWRAWPWS